MARARCRAWWIAGLGIAVLGCGGPHGQFDPMATGRVSSGLTSGVPSGTPVTLVAQNSGKCVDMTGGQVLQETCAPTLAQSWSFEVVTGGYQIVSSQDPSLCLLVASGSTTPGQDVTVAACTSGGSPGQVWNPEAVANSFNLVNTASSQCLDVGGASDANGAGLDQWTCNGQTNQVFALGTPPAQPTVSIAPGVAFNLVAQNSSKCVDIVSGTATQETCGGAATQQWTFAAVSGGYQIFSVSSPTECINLSGASTSPGEALSVSTCSGPATPGQIWNPELIGDVYELVNPNSTQCMDVDGLSTSNGAVIDQWTCLEQTNQEWALVAVGSLPDASTGSEPDASADSAPDASTPATPDASTGSEPDASAGSAPDASAATTPDASTGSEPDASAPSNPELDASSPPAPGPEASTPPSSVPEASAPEAGSEPTSSSLPTTPVTLVAQNSSKCVQYGNGAATQQTCSGVSSQSWTFVAVAAGGYQIVSAENPSLCLLIANGATTPGQDVAVAACTSGGSPGQVWNPEPVGNSFNFVNGASSQCLDVGGASDGNGAALDQWTCNGQANQVFALGAPPAPPTVSIAQGVALNLVAQNSSKCIDIVSGTATQETCSGAATQQWTFAAVGGGYQIFSVSSPTECINLPGASTSPGETLSVSACSGPATPGQIWDPQPVGDVYELVNPNSTQCMDVDGLSTSNGAVIDQWTCLEQTNQEWALVAVGSLPDASTGSEPDASTAAVPDASTGSEPDASTAAVPDASTGSEPDASTGSEPDTSTAAVPDASTGSEPDASTAAAPDASTGSPSDATAAAADQTTGTGLGSVPTTGTFLLQPQNSSLCVDITSGTPQQEPCSVSPLQQWSFRAVPGGFQFVSASNASVCLLIAGGSTTAGQGLTAGPCSSAGAPGDTWTDTASGSNYSFVSTSSGLCMDVGGASTTAGATLDQWTCNGNSNQAFALVAPPAAASVPIGSSVTITSVNGGNCLDFDEGATLQKSCWGSGSQQWTFKSVTGGYQIALADNPSQCLTLGGSTTVGQVASVTTCSVSGAPGEVWAPATSGSGITLVNLASGQCLDVVAQSTSSGAAIDQFTCNGGTNQEWAVTVIGPLPDPTVSGQWSPIYDTPSIPVAAAMMPDGQIMTWASYLPDDWSLSGLPQTYTTIVNPQTLTATEVFVTNTSHDMFCPGTAMLSDGRLLVNGGGQDVANTSIYSGSTNAWVSDALMEEVRWYNVSVTLPNGNVFTLGGNRISGLDGTGEVWTPGSGWQFVPNALMAPITTSDPANRSQEHPRLFVAPNGQIFVPGPNPNMFYYDLTGSGAVTPAGTRGNDTFSQNDATVMFDVGKILKAGGNTNYGWDTDGYDSATTPSSSSAYIIDISAGGMPVVTQIAPLNHARCFATPVVLPDGTVMVSGGLNNGETFTDVGAVFPPELFNPATQTWTDLPPAWVPRTYHSVALLMPDGRVFVGGGGLCAGCQYNHSNFQIYSPAYLFQPGRPSITSAPAYASWGTTFSIGTAGTVTSLSFVRMSSTTHAVNTDQRWMAAQASAGAGGSFTVTAPANGNIAPPGYYMLFALNGGVPSTAALIQIGP